MFLLLQKERNVEMSRLKKFTFSFSTIIYTMYTKVCKTKPLNLYQDCEKLMVNIHIIILYLMHHSHKITIVWLQAIYIKIVNENYFLTVKRQRKRKRDAYIIYDKQKYFRI